MNAYHLAWPFGLLLSAATTASGATFSLHCDGELEGRNTCVVVMHGEVEAGDADKLRRVIVSTPRFIRHLVLDSPGGNVNEALRVAAVVRRAMLPTTTYRAGIGVLTRYVCASSCFLIWVSGPIREHSTSATGDAKGPDSG